MPSKQTLIVIGIVAVVIIGGIFALQFRKPQTNSSSSTSTSSENALKTTNGTPNAAISNTGTMGASAGSVSFRSEAMGLSMQYPNTYYPSGSQETSDTVEVKLNKIKDKQTVAGTSIDRTAHFEFTSWHHTTGLSLEALAQAWGESAVGSRFVQSDSCYPRTVAGEPALKCVAYAGIDHGGYIDIVFVKHQGREFQFETLAPTNDDIIHADFNRILATIAWIN